ncbi:MAG: selenite/tellurite reduction operon protein ExtJ [Thermodesulfobacteriota bacterium]
MRKKAFLVAMVAALVLGVAGFGFAADEPFTGKITKIDGVRVTVSAQADLPAWIKAGMRVNAGGGSPLVLRVSGKDLTLKFGQAKAEQLKVDQVLEVKPSSGEVPQGC